MFLETRVRFGTLNGMFEDGTKYSNVRFELALLQL